MSKETLTFMSKKCQYNRNQRLDTYMDINQEISVLLKFLKVEVYESIENWFRVYLFILDSKFKSIPIVQFKKILKQLEELSDKFHQINVEKTELISYLQEINDGRQVG